MSQRTVAEINQHSLTLPPAQTRAFSIQIELKGSECQSLGLKSLNNSSKSDNLDPLEVGVKRERQTESPTSPSGSAKLGRSVGKHWRAEQSPTGLCKLESKFASVETQTSSQHRSVCTQTPPFEPATSVVHSPIRTPEPEHKGGNHHYGHH
jgi:hypothetical protein